MLLKLGIFFIALGLVKLTVAGIGMRSDRN